MRPDISRPSCIFQYNSSTGNYDAVDVTYNNTGGFGNMSVNNAYDYSTHYDSGSPSDPYYTNFITINIAKTTDGSVKRRCTVTWTAKRTIPLGLMEIEEYDAT